jgi:o-succinylbenzoate---CoA ligase
MNEETIRLNGKLYSSESLSELKADLSFTWQLEIFAFLENWFDDSDVIITRTSGSTGKPKEIRLTKEAMRNSARMTNVFFGLDKTKTALLCMPASYIAGKMMLVRAMEGGYNLLAVEPKANPFEKIDITIDFTAITPYQLSHSVKILKHKYVEKIIVGGGHVNTQLETLAAEIPASLYETYGMTETASHIALRCFNGSEKSDYFTVLNGVSIRQDERNCLIISAPHLTSSELTTNDIVELHGANRFKWLGRADSVINSGGVKIFPEQVEKKLEQFIEKRFFITSLPDEILENKVVLIIESEMYTTKTMGQLKVQMATALNRYEIPKDIFVVPKFIYSTSNKILRSDTLKLTNK